MRRTARSNTPWAKKYQELVDSGLIQPVAAPGHFAYPSMFVQVPSITTNRTHEIERDQEAQGAKLESDTQ
jgi:hypothetical protein